MNKSQRTPITFIDKILHNKREIKLIRAADATYMNESMYKTYGRKNVEKDTSVVISDCKTKINKLNSMMHTSLLKFDPKKEYASPRD